MIGAQRRAMLATAAVLLKLAAMQPTVATWEPAGQVVGRVIDPLVVEAQLHMRVVESKPLVCFRIDPGLRTGPAWGSGMATVSVRSFESVITIACMVPAAVHGGQKGP